MRYFITSIISLLWLTASAQRPPGAGRDTVTANGVSWTINPGDSLYISTNGGANWHWECALNMCPMSIKAKDDSTAIISNIYWDDYVYSLSTHQLSAYIPIATVAAFLTAPVISITISNDFFACFSSSYCSMVYSKTSMPSVLRTNGYRKKGDYPQKYKKTKAWRRDIDMQQLQAVLKAINDDPVSMPSVNDFEISNSDKQRYPLITKRLDTLSKALLREMLNQSEDGGQRSYWFSIEMVNSKQDTLAFYRHYSDSAHPWHLPWMVRYHQTGFKCYSLDFSKFLSGCLPKDFTGAKTFSNDELLKFMQQYLDHKDGSR